MEAAQVKNKESAGPSLPITATQKEGGDTGVSQCTPENKKPSFDQEKDLRLQVVDALNFVEEMTPDLSEGDLFYFQRTREILERLVDDEHIERASFMGFC
jgi:hypothetical protein